MPLTKLQYLIALGSLAASNGFILGVLFEGWNRRRKLKQTFSKDGSYKVPKDVAVLRIYTKGGGGDGAKNTD